MPSYAVGGAMTLIFKDTKKTNPHGHWLDCSSNQTQ